MRPAAGPSLPEQPGRLAVDNPSFLPVSAGSRHDGECLRHCLRVDQLQALAADLPDQHVLYQPDILVSYSSTPVGRPTDTDRGTARQTADNETDRQGDRQEKTEDRGTDEPSSSPFADRQSVQTDRPKNG